MGTTRYDDQELIRHCDSIIATLPIQYPFELRAFLDALGEQRETAVVLGRMPTGRGGASGLLVRARTQCWLGIAAAAVPAHVAHIAYHEIGHWLLGHPGDYVCGRRSCPDDRCEVEAEQFAYRLRAHIRAGMTRHRDRLPPGRTALRAAFGSRRHLCADA